MKPLSFRALCLVVLAGICVSRDAFSASQAETEEVARLIALLLSSGRVVLAENQALINDAEKGDKGFTAAVFEAQVVEEFKKRSGGTDLRQLDAAKIPDKGKSLLNALLAAGKEVIDGKQPVINEKFLGYKNVTPATWGTWTSQKFSQRNHVFLKQTALDYRNPNNAPDEFETRILRKFAAPDYPREGEQVLSEVTNGGQTLRLMFPLYHKKDCLVCHGTPKGEIDISGYRKEGHHEGEAAGAISVAIPLSE
jgi:general secretion pathway protein A